MDAVAGRDIGRFVFGAYSLEDYGNMTKDVNVHSLEAMAVMESFKFGEVYDA